MAKVSAIDYLRIELSQSDLTPEDIFVLFEEAALIVEMDIKNAYNEGYWDGSNNLEQNKEYYTDNFITDEDN
jgi:hypothetical protein